MGQRAAQSFLLVVHCDGHSVRRQVSCAQQHSTATVREQVRGMQFYGMNYNSIESTSKLGY